MSAYGVSRDLGDSLFCCESGVFEQEPVCKAIRDPALLNDRRVLANLLDTEGRYMASCSYFKCVQNEIKLPMRRILAYWMVEVSRLERGDGELLSVVVRIALPARNSVIKLSYLHCHWGPLSAALFATYLVLH